MKKANIIFSIVFVLVLLIGCQSENINGEEKFKAIVLENETTTLIVEPIKGANELNNAKKIIVLTEGATLIDQNGKERMIQDIIPNMEVEIYYDGAIAESDPPQIQQCQKIVLLDK